MTISAIVCAYNEAQFLSACLFSLLTQTRPPDEILVINNASTDETGAAAREVPGVRVIDEPAKGLVVARETARRHATGDILAYLDADCRAPIFWLERVEGQFRRRVAPVGVSGPYRFYDWDWRGRVLIRLYDFIVAPPTCANVDVALTLYRNGSWAA
jgi:glycosyltransferase involved in cell wall biosynthesis